MNFTCPKCNKPGTQALCRKICESCVTMNERAAAARRYANSKRSVEDALAACSITIQQAKNQYEARETTVKQLSTMFGVSEYKMRVLLVAAGATIRTSVDSKNGKPYVKAPTSNGENALTYARSLWDSAIALKYSTVSITPLRVSM